MSQWRACRCRLVSSFDKHWLTISTVYISYSVSAEVYLHLHLHFSLNYCIITSLQHHWNIYVSRHSPFLPMEKNTQRFITKHTPHRIENIGTLDVIPKCKKYLVKRTTNNHLFPIYNFTFVLFGFSIFCVFITYIKGCEIQCQRTDKTRIPSKLNRFTKWMKLIFGSCEEIKTFFSSINVGTWNWNQFSSADRTRDNGLIESVQCIDNCYHFSLTVHWWRLKLIDRASQMSRAQLWDKRFLKASFKWCSMIVTKSIKF